MVLVSAGTTGLAQWQWLDKDGRKVFSDRAPASDVPEKNILKRPAGSAATASNATVKPDQPKATDALLSIGRSEPTELEKEVAAKKKQAADAAAAKQKSAEEANMQLRIENCARAKQAKATVDSGVRLARASATGEKEVLDDAGRAAETKRIQEVINRECR